jgi:hypothetical protein
MAGFDFVGTDFGLDRSREVLLTKRGASQLMRKNESI